MFLPLRSNAGWFTTAETRAALERRLKMHALLYDRIVLQDGRYRCVVLERGMLDYLNLGDAASPDRTHIRYHTPGSEFSFQVSANRDGAYSSVLQGEPIASYEVDFYPVVHDGGLLECAFIEWLTNDITDEARSHAKALASRDLRDAELRSNISSSHFVASTVLNSLYIDAMMSDALQLPFVADPHVSAAINWNAAQIASRLAVDARGAVDDTWVSLNLPDWGAASWEEVVRTRESAPGRQFREVVSQIAERAKTILAEGGDRHAISHLVHQQFVHQLIAEVFERRTTGLEVGVNLLMNFVPMGAAVTTQHDIRKLIAERNSWVSLLEGPRDSRRS